MTQWPALPFGLLACALFALGVGAFLLRSGLLKKIMAINVAGSGVFLLFAAIAFRGGDAAPDPVPQAMVLTGIVVAVCATAVALVLGTRVPPRSGPGAEQP